MRKIVLAVGLILVASAMVGFSAHAVSIEWVTVGDPINAGDDSGGSIGVGGVGYEFRIAKYETTNSQYAEFLNAVATNSDPNGLYDDRMNTTIHGGITRVTTPSGWAYAVKGSFVNKPVTYVSPGNALRFINWMANGQGNGDTEIGAYTLNGGNSIGIERNANASIFLPNQNEWYKAAFYEASTTSFFSYPTQSNSFPQCGEPTSSPNSANCYHGPNPLLLHDVGSYTGSEGPYGTFDQAGNAWEWIDDNVSSGTRRRMWGGSAWDNTSGYFSSSGGGSSSSQDHKHAAIGFRVASVIPEPSTALLLGLGLVGMAARRRG